MVNWGLGIEHEMRIRFSNKLNMKDLNNPIIKKIVEKYQYIPDYLFINCKLLLSLFKNYAQKILSYYNVKNKISNLNIEKSDPYIYLKYCIKNNLNYPLDHSKYFNQKDGINTNHLFWYYIQNYMKYYKKDKFIFSTKFFYFYDKNNMLISEQNIYYILDNYLRYNNKNKSFTKKEVELFLNKFRKGIFEIEFIKNIKEFLKDYNFFNNIIYNLGSNDFDIIKINYVKENKNKNKITFDIIEKKINNSLSNINKNTLNIFLKKFNDPKLLNILYDLLEEGIPHIDFSSKVEALEFKTYDFKNNNYKKQLDDLLYIEELFFNIVNEIPELQPYIQQFGKICYHNTGSLDKTISLTNLNDEIQEVEKDYSGSFHVWITIPYEEKDSPETFIQRHASLGNRLQLLEPIFSSYFTSPDLNSIGNNLTHSRTSLRQFLNGYSGYGTSNIKLLYGTNNNLIYKYYLSKEDVLKNNYINLDKFIKIYDSTNNKLIKNYDGLITRGNTTKLYDQYFKKNNYNNYNNNNKNNKNIINNKDEIIENYLIKLFKETKIRPEEHKIPLGADIRTLDMNKLFYPNLNEDYEKVYILENNKFIQYYLNIKTNEITNKPLYDIKSYKKFLKEGRVGIEFRIFDHQPTSNLIQFLAICAQLVSYSINHHKILGKKDIFINKQLWHDEMYQSMIQGFEYECNKDYIKLIEKEFQLNFGKEIIKNMSGEIFFKNFYDKMNSKLSKDLIYKKIQIHKQDVVFESFNKNVWKYNFFLYLENNKNLLPLIISIIYSNKNNSSKKEELLELLGNNFQYDINKILIIMDIPH